MKYTEHKLTDAMLQRLSKITKGRPCGGNSIGALESRGLVRVTGDSWQDHHDRYTGAHVEATELGIQALARARAEGW